ncbi:HNH endonuclease [Lysinibacillus sp. 38-6]|uniref:HNH endonuclease n=1 Tax=Lysinibacillus sp. 38-6 TaxID=3385991 RepID=UPI003908A299
MINEMMRKCRICKETKPLTEFTRQATAPQGRQARCKSCRSKAQYESGDYLRERIRKHEYRHNGANHYTDVTIQEVLNATNCAYCDVEMTRGKCESSEATVDHVYLGHNIDANVVVCCRSCNASKGRLHVYDFYQSSEQFTDELWHAFVSKFASRFLKREPNEQEIEAWKQGFKEESEERKQYGT